MPGVTYTVAMPGQGELQTVAKFMTSPNINPVEKKCRPPNNHAGNATCLIATRWYFMFRKKDYDWQQYHCNHCHPLNSLVSRSQAHQNKITWVKSSSPCIDVLYLDGNLLVSSSFYVKCLQVGLFIWRYPALCLCWNIEVTPSAMLR